MKHKLITGIFSLVSWKKSNVRHLGNRNVGVWVKRGLENTWSSLLQEEDEEKKSPRPPSSEKSKKK